MLTYLLLPLKIKELVPFLLQFSENSFAVPELSEQYFVPLTSLYYPEQALTEGQSIYAEEIAKMADENLVEFLNTSIHKGQTKKIIPLKRANLSYLSGTEVCFLHR